jgi:hypothetical protein
MGILSIPIGYHGKQMKIYIYIIYLFFKFSAGLLYILGVGNFKHKPQEQALTLPTP